MPFAGSYGSTKRYKDIDRIIRVNDTTVLGAGGELSDFAHIAKLLDELVMEDFVFDDGIKLTAPEAHAYLTRVMYNRRNKCALYQSGKGVAYRHKLLLLLNMLIS